MLDLKTIDTVLLDMDGTLLDLHFDNHFWLEHVPRRYAEARGIPLADASAELMTRYRDIQGTLNWYLSLIHISEPTRLVHSSRMPSSA